MAATYPVTKDAIDAYALFHLFSQMINQDTPYLAATMTHPEPARALLSGLASHAANLAGGDPWALHTYCWESMAGLLCGDNSDSAKKAFDQWAADRVAAIYQQQEK